MSSIPVDPLSELALKFGTDKYGSHYYTPHYYRNFKHLCGSQLKILEIGVGGYEDKQVGAESLKMWKEFFPNAQIVGVDIEDKRHLSEERITILKGSQVDLGFLDQVVQNHGPFDIIIDDGSHQNQHIITTFEHLFPTLASEGVYVVEDIQTAYWPDFGGDSYYLKQDNSTCMGYFKSLLDSLHYEENLNPNYVPSYLDKNIVGLQFYHNIAFIQKGNNEEGTTAIKPAPGSEPQWKSTLKVWRSRLKSFLI